MKTENETKTAWAFVGIFLLFLAILLLLWSCSKPPQDTGVLDFQAAFSPDENINHACNHEPKYAKIEINGRSHKIDLTLIKGGVFGTFELALGKHEVSNITIYNTLGTAVYEVKPQGYSKYQVVFVPFTFTQRHNTKMGLQIFCVNN